MKQEYYVVLLTEEDAVDTIQQINTYVLAKYHFSLEIEYRKYEDGWRIMPHNQCDIDTMQEAIRCM